MLQKQLSSASPTRIRTIDKLISQFKTEIDTNKALIAETEPVYATVDSNTEVTIDNMQAIEDNHIPRAKTLTERLNNKAISNKGILQSTKKQTKDLLPEQHQRAMTMLENALQRSLEASSAVGESTKDSISSVYASCGV